MGLGIAFRRRRSLARQGQLPVPEKGARRLSAPSRSALRTAARASLRELPRLAPHIPADVLLATPALFRPRNELMMGVHTDAATLNSMSLTVAVIDQQYGVCVRGDMRRHQADSGAAVGLSNE